MEKKAPLLSRAFWVLELQIMEYAAWFGEESETCRGRAGEKQASFPGQPAPELSS